MNRRRHPKGAGHRRAAFSLVETVIAVLLLGILAATAGPSIADALSRYRVTAAAERIVADMAYARRRARSSSAARSMTFDPSSDNYTVSGVDDLEHRGTTYTVALDAEPYRTTLVSADFGGGATVQFNGFGGASESGTVVLRSGGFEKTVAVDSETGEARVE